jgi:polysaccharide deacetylase 2 family uncharacterized protein YibQ
MSKKKLKKLKKTKKAKKSPLLIINIIITILLLITLAFLINLFIADTNYEDQQKQLELKKQQALDKEYAKQQLKKQQALLFEEKTKAMEIEYAESIDISNNTTVSTKKQNTFIYPKNTIQKENIQKVESKPIKALPKLAIIIDDVTSSYQITKIKNIPYPVTMAFLPPTSKHKNSAKISQDINTYMIHLPLEAGSRRFEEENTLHINDSISKIEHRIRNLKKLYPRAKYINNHTGSKFTSNDKSMDKLIKILKKYNYTFLDSRTTAKTVASKYANKYHLTMLSRNIFLDNKQDKQYIKNQLTKAVKMAKKHGFAIAICHPHNITLKTLAQSKYLFEDINLVLINNIK